MEVKSGDYVQFQLGSLSDLESHLATLGAMPNLAQASDYLGALTITPRPLQVALGTCSGSLRLEHSVPPLLFC